MSVTQPLPPPSETERSINPDEIYQLLLSCPKEAVAYVLFTLSALSSSKVSFRNIVGLLCPPNISNF